MSLATVLKKSFLSSNLFKSKDESAGDIITILFGKLNFDKTNLLIPGHAPPIIAISFFFDNPSISLLVFSISVQPESTLDNLNFILLKKFSRDTISLNGNSIESAIDGVNVSTNPVNPKKIPIFILSSELELETEVNK